MQGIMASKHKPQAVGTNPYASMMIQQQGGRQSSASTPSQGSLTTGTMVLNASYNVSEGNSSLMPGQQVNTARWASGGCNL